MSLNSAKILSQGPSLPSLSMQSEMNCTWESGNGLSRSKLELSRTPTFPIKIHQKAGLISCVRVFNPMKDLDTKDTYTRNFLNSMKKKLSYCPDTSHECAARLIRKCINFFEKYTYWNLAKPGTYITCALKVS